MTQPQALPRPMVVEEYVPIRSRRAGQAKWLRLEPMFAAEIRRRRVGAFRAWRWHLDEMFVRVNGAQYDLWRVLGYEGEVPEAFVSRTRDRKAELKSLKKLTKRHGRPEDVVTDKLRAYGTALKELGAKNSQTTRRWEDNRAETSHLPFRRRERAMQRFRRMHSLQWRVAVQSSVTNHLKTDRSLSSRPLHEQARTAALAKWEAPCAR